MEDLIGYLVLIFIFVVLPAVLNRMAKKRAAQQAQARQAEGSPEEEQPAEAERQEEARPSQVERYLESLGIKVERRPASQPPPPTPSQRPMPPPTLRPEPQPAQTPSQGTLVYEASPADVQHFLQERQRHPAAHEAAPLRPHRVRVAAPPPAPPAEPAPAHPKAPASTAPRPRRRPLGVLGHHPTRTELQKAVVLSEVIRRPDFDRDPFERLII
jgi:hypothetical protein